jgi:hypothetical protein
MIKVAIFTEGQTEQLFVCEAISQLAAGKSYYIANERKNGSGAKMIKISVDKIGDDTSEIYFQVCDCGSDSQVLSTVIDEYQTLVAADFTHIIAVRDLYPIPLNKLENLLTSIQKRKPSGPVDPLFVVALLETEAWFIAENNHFIKINATLTQANILAGTSLDITKNSEDFLTPSADLHAIYAVAGEAYEKSRATVNRTVEALDMSQYFQTAGARAQSVVPLLTRLQSIFV